MKKTTSYGPMKGILSLKAGQVIETKKNGFEITHDFKQILESLDGEDVTVVIKHHEMIDEDNNE